MKKTKTSLFIRGLPNVIHREFKARCAKEGISMNQKVQQLLTQFINGNQKEEKR